LSQAQEAPTQLPSPKASPVLPSSPAPPYGSSVPSLSSPSPSYKSSFTAPSPSAPSLSAPLPSSPLPSSSLPSSLQPLTAVRRRPQVLSINTLQLDRSSLPQLSSSPSSPPDAEVRLTIRELLAQLGLPEEPSSLGVLQELGLLPVHTSLTPSPSSSSPPSPPSPPYVPPQRRQASPVPASSFPINPALPTSSAPRASSVPHTSSASPQPSSPLPSSRAAPAAAPAPALGPPFI
jgi:hypothetical protein